MAWAWEWDTAAKKSLKSNVADIVLEGKLDGRRRKKDPDGRGLVA